MENNIAMEQTNLILADLLPSAQGAYRNLSQDPDRCAKSTIQEFSAELSGDLAGIPQGDHPTYIERYKWQLRAWLGALSNCASWHVTGRANFPVERMEKRNRSADNRYNEFRKWRENALKGMAHNVEALKTPEERVDEAWVKIKAKISSSAATIMAIDKGEERRYNRALFVSSITGLVQRQAENGQVVIVNRALDFIQELNDKSAKPVITKHNSIWALRTLVVANERQAIEAQTGPVVEKLVNDIRVVFNPALDRVQLIFKDKAHAMRYRRHLNGWHWSPTMGAWQRKLTKNAKQDAEQIASMVL